MFVTRTKSLRDGPYEEQSVSVQNRPTPAYPSRMSRESIIAEIRAEVTKLNHILDLLGSPDKGHKPVKAKRARRHMSAAVRRRIAVAQRARWAKIRAGKK